MGGILVTYTFGYPHQVLGAGEHKPDPRIVHRDSYAGLRYRAWSSRRSGDGFSVLGPVGGFMLGSMLMGD